MIPNSSLRYYLDPLQSPFHTGTEMLVFRERFPRLYDPAIGKVVKVVKRVMNDHHLWWVSEDGRYVDGALVSPKELVSHQPAVGMLDDETFIVGTAYGMTDGDRMVIRDALRSDGKVLPGGETRHPRTYAVDRWLQAAPWASECMPYAGDDQAAVDLKLMIAEQKFRLRLGEACILREANERDWRDDLADLDYSLPTPSYAVAVEGSVYVAVDTPTSKDDLPESSRVTLERIMGKNFVPRDVPSVMTTRVEVPASFVVKTSFEKYEGVEEVDEHTLRNAAVHQFDIHNVTLGSVTKTPVLRSIY